jgi:hypothetical protein
MSTEGIIWLFLSIGGAAAIGGGFIFYRGSTTTGKRAAGAALMAAGIAMWFVLVATIPVSVSDGASPEPEIVFQNN